MSTGELYDDMMWQERCERAESAVAELKDVIQSIGIFKDDMTGWKLTPEKVSHAISSDCGKGWVSPEQHAHEVGILRAKLLDAEAIVKRWASMAGDSDRKLTLAVEALKRIASSAGNYCECNQPIELCVCAERIARETLATIEGKDAK